MAGSESPPRVVVVEDNDTDVLLLRLALSEHKIDYELIILEDGEAAMTYLAGTSGQAAPSLIVLDLNLPKRDGLEVLESLRRSTSLAHVPVMIPTSSNSPREKERAERLGVSAYLHKPNDLDAFLSVGAVIAELVKAGGKFNTL